MTIETTWEIPDPISADDVLMEDNSVITLRRHGNPEGPRLILSHGNGLAIDLYYPFWSLLADDFDLVIYDLRNHGWNAVGRRQDHNVPSIISDQTRLLEGIDNHYGKKPKFGVFHSLSALTTLMSPGQGKEFVARILFDPPLCKPPHVTEEEFDAAAAYVAAMTRKRAARFQTPEDFAELLRYMPAFHRVLPGVLALMARTTLRKSSTGQDYELRCPREYEAQIIEYVRSFSVLVDLDTMLCPTKIVGADPTLPYSYLPTIDLSHIMTVDYDFLPETTHFLPLEQPEECAKAVQEFIEAVNAGEYS